MKASVSWLAFMMHIVPNRPAMAKKRARGFHFGPMPFSMMCIGPPWGLPMSSLPLYMMARTPSWYFVAMPTTALTHIQKMAPGPPMTRAIATPAMLPIPTVAPITEVRAWTEEICPAPESPAPRLRSSRMEWGSRLIDTAPEDMKRYRPPPMSRKKRG